MTLLNSIINNYSLFYMKGKNLIYEVCNLVDSVYLSLKAEGVPERLLLFNTSMTYDICIDDCNNDLYKFGIFHIILELNFDSEKINCLCANDVIPYRITELKGNVLGINTDLISVFKCNYRLIEIGCNEIPSLDLHIENVIYDCKFSGIKIHRLLTENNIEYLFGMGIEAVDILVYSISYNKFNRMLLKNIFIYFKYIISKYGQFKLNLTNGAQNLYYWVYTVILGYVNENNLPYIVKIDFNIVTIER